MDRFCLGVVAGALLALWLPALPDPLYLLLLSLSLVLAAHRFAGVLGICCYLLVLSWHHQAFVQQQQQLQLQDNTEVCVQVESLVRQFNDSIHFVAQLLPRCKQQAQANAGARLALSWYAPTANNTNSQASTAANAAYVIAVKQLQSGQHWLLTLRLRPFYGTDNPGAPERSRLALVAGQHGKASISQGQLLLDRVDWRQHLVQQLTQCCAHYQSLPLWLALTLGERPFSDELWLGVQASGLAHLLSISGMHISLLFGMVLLLVQLTQRYSGAPRWLLWYGALLALLLAWGYASLAGMAVPTLRAVLSLTLVLLLQQLHRRYNLWQLGWLLSAMLLLAWPYLLFSFSFWLSLVALALLAFLSWQYPAQLGWRGAICQFLRFQLGFSLLLQPLTLLLFGGVAPAAFAVNLVVVPLITLLVMPVLALVFAALLVTGTVPLWLADLLDGLLQPLYTLLEAMAAPQYWWAWPDVPVAAIILFALAMCWLWLPVGWWRLLALPSLLPLFFALTAPVKPQFFLLDVGQGSSAVLQQGRHALVVDLGPAHGRWSATAQILLPFLRSRGISKLDGVVISHDDADHSGDWPLLLKHFPATPLVSDIRRLAPRYHCSYQWRFAEVIVTTFRASIYRPEPANEDSCAVLLRYGQHSLLLPGDIGRREQALVAWSGPVDILVLGHHGSKSSSSLAMLQQLQPQLALASAGLANRFGHPSQQTQARLQLYQIPLLRTDHHGAIRINWQPNGWQIQSSRQQRLAPWVEKSLFPAETVQLNR